MTKAHVWSTKHGPNRLLRAAAVSKSIRAAMTSNDVRVCAFTSLRLRGIRIPGAYAKRENCSFEPWLGLACNDLHPTMKGNWNA
jgi:hypothetical protein